MLDRYFGCIFGNLRNYNFPPTKEGLAQAVTIADKIDAQGLEIRFDGFYEIRGRMYIPIDGPKKEDIEKIFLKTLENYNDVIFHLSEYAASILFDRREYPFEDINQLIDILFDKSQLVVIHPHYEEIILRLEDIKLQKILNLPLKERMQYLSEEIFSQKLKSKFAVENGKNLRASPIRTFRFANKYGINMVLDSGHFIQSFLKQEKGKKFEDIRVYSPYLIDCLSDKIIHAHVHGVRNKQAHFPLDSNAFITEKQKEVLWKLYAKAHISTYTLEVWRGTGKDLVESLLNTCNYFENQYEEAKKS